MGFLLRDLLARVPEQMESRFQCPTNKTAFDTKAEARRALTRINPGQRRAMRAYRCTYCERYHLGHRRGNVF